MNKRILTLVFIACGLTWLLNACEQSKSNGATAENAQPSRDSLIKRGNYLVTTIGCNDCHSPKRMGPHGPEIDSLNMLSGFPSNRPVPVAGPNDIKNGLIVFNSDLTACIGLWGTTFAANITSDETGIGNWTEEQFKKVLRKGKYMGMDGSRPIMPPMPWEELGKLNDGDIKAIFFYLKSTKPFKNVVPAFRPAGGKM